MKNESKSWWHVFLSWQIMALCMFFSNIPVSYAQSPDKITVAGCVKDAAGDFLIGATVQVKGISGGTITDIDLYNLHLHWHFLKRFCSILSLFLRYTELKASFPYRDIKQDMVYET